ncbi:MAG: MFS transporter [Phycisphaerae bacterium]|nr:MFS transporter [Phycisphaerae bacterium]
MLRQITTLLRPAPEIDRIRDAAKVERQYAYWRQRILYASLIGYAVFYLVRKNLPIAMPVMQETMGVTKADLGLFLTLHGVLYGVSKFANGFLGDRTNPRWFMALGLLLSAMMNIFCGFTGAALTFGVFWVMNGWFQGMGFPPCARSLTQWFSPAERGTKFALWNTSHSIGAAAALGLCSLLVTHDWRLCFLVPAVVAVAGAVFLVDRLRDSPQSLGLPPIETYWDMHEGGSGQNADADSEATAFREFVIHRVLLNPMIWVVSLANFFVYTLRYALLDWGPTMLSEMKGIHVSKAGWSVAAYELAGVAGMLLSGWMTDRVFRGRAGRACAVWMGLCGVCVWLFWRSPSQSPLVYSALLCAAGFFIYGPQCLVGVIAANLASRRAAATAIGLTGLLGYLSTVLSGWGLGRIADTAGWDPVFVVLLASAVVAGLLFVLCWNAVAVEHVEKS